MKGTSPFCLLFTLLMTFTATADELAAVRNGSGEEIILQGFQWNSSRNEEKSYAVLQRMATTIGNDGFSLIWLPRR